MIISFRTYCEGEVKWFCHSVSSWFHCISVPSYETIEYDVDDQHNDAVQEGEIIVHINGFMKILPLSTSA